jgi:hypothetical protein
MIFITVTAQDVYDLSANKWLLRNDNNTIKLGVTVPAHVLELARAAGLIDDPLYR